MENIEKFAPPIDTSSCESPLIPPKENESPSELSLCQRIYICYFNAIKTFIEFIWKHEWYTTASVLSTLLLEPWQAIKAGFLSVANWKSHFNYYDMNPITLMEDQLKKQPILLIHGNYHNQSAWLDLAKELQLQNIGPVYTVNVPNREITEVDYEIVQKKIDEIKEQYKNHNSDIKINLIGHSRGAYLAHQFSWWNKYYDGKFFWNRSEDIGKVIKIGQVLKQKEIDTIQKWYPDFKDRVYEITGKYDFLYSPQSFLQDTHKKEIDMGHLGLIYSPDTHQQIIKWLKE